MSFPPSKYGEESTSLSPEAQELSPWPIRVLLSDSSRMGAQMFKEVLARDRAELKILFSSSKSDEIVKKAVDEQPDVAVLSLALEDGPRAGLDVLGRILDNAPATRLILMIDAHPEADVVLAALRNGARGIFSRLSSINELEKCILTVHKGQLWLGNKEIEFLVDAVSKALMLNMKNVKGEEILTYRERDIVNLVAAGMTNAEISEKLGLSEHTVKNYMFRIFDKIGVSSRVELVLYGLNFRDAA
jgi:DNA-binding NarL/FixJ family response regulator